MHFPGGRPRRTLSVILPYEARTFLTVIPFGTIPRDCPAQSSNIITAKEAKVKPFYIEINKKTVGYYKKMKITNKIDKI